jgi:hypothetical protein
MNQYTVMIVIPRLCLGREEDIAFPTLFSFGSSGGFVVMEDIFEK